MNLRQAVSIALVLALGALGWVPATAAACDRPCCNGAGAERPVTPRLSADGCCCDAPTPCDLEQGRTPEVPARAVTGGDRLIHAESCAPAAASPAERPAGVPALPASRTAIPGTAPPTPLFLRNASLLC